MAAPPPPPTKATHFREVSPVAAFIPVEQPEGATSPGTDEWYRAPAPDGANVVLGVYRPAGPPVGTLLVLHGGSGLRTPYEDLAARLADSGFLTIVGCWSDDPQALWELPDVSCWGGPQFKGSSTAAAADVQALVAATLQVPGAEDASRLVLVGHSYGAAAAFVRAAELGATEPIVAVAGLLAPEPRCDCAARPGDRYAADDAAAIHAPVLVQHGAGDPITPIGQADALEAAMAAAGSPITVIRYPSSVGHTPFWQLDTLGTTTVAQQVLEDLVAWVHGQLGIVTGLDAPGASTRPPAESWPGPGAL